MSTTAAGSAGPAAARPASRLSPQDVGMLAVCVIWGANFSVMKLAMARIEPLAFTAIRFVAGSLLLWAVVRWREGPARPLPPGSVWRLVWLGVVGNTLYQLGFVLGLDRSTATNTALIISAVPAAVAVLGAVLGIERTTSRMRWGIAIGMLGVGIVVAARGGVSFGLETLAGDLLTLGAMLAWSAYTIGLRSLPGELSPLRVSAWTTYTGTPGLVLAGLPGLARTDWGALGAGPWLALAYATVLSLVVAYLIWNTSVRVVGGNRTAIYMCLTPLVATLVAWVALGERPGVLHAVGAVLIIGGVLLTRLGGGRKRAAEPDPVPAEG